jgi:hypothetical protein
MLKIHRLLFIAVIALMLFSSAPGAMAQTCTNVDPIQDPLWDLPPLDGVSPGLREVIYRFPYTVLLSEITVDVTLYGTGDIIGQPFESTNMNPILDPILSDGVNVITFTEQNVDGIYFYWDSFTANASVVVNSIVACTTTLPPVEETPQPWQYEEIAGQVVRYDFIVTAGDVMVSVLLLLTLFSMWGLGAVYLLVNRGGSQ